MNKLLKFGPYFYDTYEPVLQILDLEKAAGTKVASEAYEYIKTVEPKEGKTIILVIAMGAGEWWGANRNGDFFPEADLLLNYKNFETTFSDEGKINGGALIYKHHKNKLANGDPWFGIVRQAFYNHRMHRIELLLEVDNVRAGDTIDKINRGDEVAVSMGVRIPYDICSICGHHAPRVSEYCDHLKYQMGKILADGRKVYAINGNYDHKKHKKPLNFFDISLVFRPADQTGYMIKKVAHFEEICEGSAMLAEALANQTKISEVMKKLSDMHKYVRGDIAAVKDESGELKAMGKFMQGGLGRAVEQMKPISDEKIENLSKHPIADVLTTLSKSNIILTTPEFIKLVVKKLTGKSAPEALVQMFTDLQAEIFEEFAENPDKVEELSSLPMFGQGVHQAEIDEELADVAPSRDLSEKSLTKKADVDFTRSVLDLQRGGMLDAETITAPNGKKYMANTDAIEDAQFWSMLKEFSLSMGTAAALAGVYSYLTKMGPTGKAIAPVALVATAYMGIKGLTELGRRPWQGDLKTDSGKMIPRTTMMIEKKSAASDNLAWRVAAPLSAVGTTVLLNRYYKNKLDDGTAGQYATTLGKHLDTAGEYAYHHPFITTGGMLLASSAPQAISGKIKDYWRSTKP